MPPTAAAGGDPLADDRTRIAIGNENLRRQVILKFRAAKGRVHRPRCTFDFFLRRLQRQALGRRAVVEVDFKFRLNMIAERLNEKVGGFFPIGNAISDVVQSHGSFRGQDRSQDLIIAVSTSTFSRHANGVRSANHIRSPLFNFTHAFLHGTAHHIWGPRGPGCWKRRLVHRASSRRHRNRRVFSAVRPGRAGRSALPSRTRPKVRWAVNLRCSRGKPNGSSTRSTA